MWSLAMLKVGDSGGQVELKNVSLEHYESEESQPGYALAD